MWRNQCMKECVTVVANGLLLNMIDATNGVKTNDNNRGVGAFAALPPLYLLSPECSIKDTYTKDITKQMEMSMFCVVDVDINCTG